MNRAFTIFFSSVEGGVGGLQNFNEAYNYKRKLFGLLVIKCFL